jgi:hypothetical protein
LFVGGHFSWNPLTLSANSEVKTRLAVCYVISDYSIGHPVKIKKNSFPRLHCLHSADSAVFRHKSAYSIHFSAVPSLLPFI